MQSLLLIYAGWWGWSECISWVIDFWLALLNEPYQIKVNFFAALTWFTNNEICSYFDLGFIQHFDLKYWKLFRLAKESCNKQWDLFLANCTTSVNAFLQAPSLPFSNHRKCQQIIHFLTFTLSVEWKSLLFFFASTFNLYLSVQSVYKLCAKHRQIIFC